jgi:hypothetical protein
MERYNTGLIAYSLGNYVFPVQGNTYFADRPATAWGMMLQVDVAGEVASRKLNYRVIPVTIDSGNRTVLSEGTEKDDQNLALSEISQRLAQPSFLRRKWFWRCVAEAKWTAMNLYYIARRQGLGSMCRALLRTVRTRYERRWMYSILTGGFLG